MTRNSSGTEVIEIRRFCLRSATDISSFLRGLRFEARPGGETVIRPDDYDDGIRRLKRAGLDVLSVRDRDYELGTILYTKAMGKRWGYRVTDPDQWSYLSMITRRWRRCRVDNQSRILLRRGMALADHGTGGQPKYYLIPEDIVFDTSFRLENYKTRGDKAIRGAYHHVLGTLPVPFWDTGSGLLLALWPNYVIPKEHETFLSKVLNPLNESLDSADGGTLWVWHPTDRELIERILRELRLRLAPWDAGTDWVNTASLIMRRSYTEYLQRHDGAKELRDIIRRKCWEEIQDPVLSQLVSKLIKLEYEGDNASNEFLRFMQDELTVVTNYKDHDNHLLGWVIESSPVFYQGKQLNKRYYRLVLPGFDTATGWETTRHPDWDGEDKPRIKMFQWQNVPYVGRMKTMSRAPEPEPDKAGRKLRDQALRSLAGIPSVEWGLVKEKAFAAFMLDLDGVHWKGCNDLCRYFTGFGRILSRNPIECEGHGLLLCDVFGNKLALETEELPSDAIPDDGEWVHFIGHSSLLQHQEWLRLDQDIPVFDLARDRIFRRAYASHALEGGLLAWIKYHWGLSQEDVITPFARAWTEDQIRAALDALVRDEQIVKVKEDFYYRYSSLNISQMKEYIGRKYANEAFERTRTLLHPLYVRSMRLARKEAMRDLLRFTNGYKTIVRSSDSDYTVSSTLQNSLEQRGWCCLLAAGAQVNRVQNFVHHFANENPNMLVYRKDGKYQFRDGSNAPSVEYVCWDPIKELKLRFS
jgi:hypothetical protein